MINIFYRKEKNQQKQEILVLLVSLRTARFCFSLAGQ